MQTTTVLLLDRWKARYSVTSDNQAAIRLGVTRATVSSWRHWKSHAEAPVAARMASDLRVEVLPVLAAIEADRARTDDARRIWARYGKGAFMALLVGVALAEPPAPALAQAPELAHVTPHYAKRRRGRGSRLLEHRRSRWQDTAGPKMGLSVTVGAAPLHPRREARTAPQSNDLAQAA